jgi:hypothetical protein
MLAWIIFNIVIIAVMVWCGRFTARQAVRKGRSWRRWFLLGALFFPFPSIVLALLPSHGEDDGTPAPPPPAKRGFASALLQFRTDHTRRPDSPRFSPIT